MLTLGSMFSGVGLLDLGLERAGMRVIWHAESDAQASKVLAHHWPGVPNLGDVTQVDWSSVEVPDVLAGGFPCQPFSSAGKRRGESDDRYLWPIFADAIRNLRPRLVILENVAALLSAPEWGTVLGDLAETGFDCRWACVRASDIGAPHRRERVFVVAHARKSRGGPSEPDLREGEPDPSGSAHANADRERLTRGSESDLGALEPGQQAPRRGDAGGCGDPAPHPGGRELQRRGERRELDGPQREAAGAGDQRERDGDTVGGGREVAPDPSDIRLERGGGTR